MASRRGPSSMLEENIQRELRRELKKSLQWLMFFRIILATFFLGIVVILQVQRSHSYLVPYLIHLYWLAGTVYVLTFIYAFILPIIKNLKIFTYVQIMVDIFLISVLVFVTGGANSIFAFMYSISIISASILLYRFGGLLTATVTSFCYSLLLNFQYYQIIPTPLNNYFIAKGYEGAPVYYPIIVNVTAFYLVALLSSFLAEQARKSKVQLHEKQSNIENLEVLNENIIQSINSGLLTLDSQGYIITFNRAAQKITGLAHSQVYLNHINEIFPDVKLAEDQVERNPDNDSLNFRFEMSFTKPDGKKLQLGFSSSNLTDAKGIEMGKILVFQDLTSFQTMREYIRRMDRLAAVGQLAAGIAHEIRNPLASISGSIQVLSKSLQPNDSDSRLMDIILRESNNLNLLISDFTQFAKPNRQRRESVHLKGIFDETLELFHNSPECMNGLTIRCDVADNIALEVDTKQLKQVLWNLIINGAQSILNGGGMLSIVGRLKEEGFHPFTNEQQPQETVTTSSSWIEISVQDTGCGIAREEQEKIFDPFYTTKDSGTGLGLSIVHKIIQEHGGTIAVNSTKGQGTCLTIYLPQ
jgi:two-component system sensor histidine kinase PilS (NtrC family)